MLVPECIFLQKRSHVQIDKKSEQNRHTEYLGVNDRKQTDFIPFNRDILTIFWGI